MNMKQMDQPIDEKAMREEWLYWNARVIATEYRLNANEAITKFRQENGDPDYNDAAGYFEIQGELLEYQKRRNEVEAKLFGYSRYKDCGCGRIVPLRSSWANKCGGCGTEYNGAGQMLAPRHQWGEETGEQF